MEEMTSLTVIARIHNGFPEKFGIPRQSGLVSVPARIVFEPAFRNPDALRGLEGYTHLWLIWRFSEVKKDNFAPTVRPPRLGGNIRMGVFATRSPNRPNPLGLSCVRLDRIELGTPDGPVLHIFGADLLDNTALFDIKPYLPYTDAHPDAAGGFARGFEEPTLSVKIPDALMQKIPPESRLILTELLAQDPRPGYQDDPTRIYTMAYGGQQIRFTVTGDSLTVTDVF